MNKHKQHVNGLIALIATAVVVVAGLLVWQHIESQEAMRLADAASASMEAKAAVADFSRGNRYYRLRNDLSTILLIGYDKPEDEEIVDYYDGGQADFLLLLVVDNTGEVVNMLQIDRDTMTRVNVMGATGRPAGSKISQICMAHSYGGTIVQNDNNTRVAVENFLGGVRIDYTVSMRISGIKTINHLLGGVTVTVEDDLTAVDPALAPGVTLTLTDEQAELFCRARRTVSDGTNISRMRRQKAYMEAAAKLVQDRVARSGSFANSLVDGMMDATNMMDANNNQAPKGWFINQLNKAATFTINRPVSLPGVRTVNDAGYVEIRVDQNDVVNWVIENLCYEF